ncbi:bifunctional nuclease family protein [Natrarchaeobius oligotrophus]|uniref:Bifunctional nuclease family protein n=1 Tax=Natrarchaeobius chitinivorans TaxID=1679083 RepID=A0A3N6M234_NATCH|nr:bifunctional nuclease family protein [Natrarchaeobius chitinivorans]RQG97413.1 bifunctional nuclease family protein [Natrarchaeobius chitinivorans]
MQASIDAIRVAGTPQGPVPVVVLAVDDEDDVVPIFIGFNEATSIARGLEAEDIGRPLTHDLLLDVVEELGCRIDRVVVNEIEARDDGRGGTYIADLHVQTPRGETVIDARPSDSLALAARTNAPIEVTADVFESGRDDSEKFEELQDIRAVSGEL